jgi:threonine synthase
MEYYSLEGKAPKVGFREAALRGIAPDRGLYFPERIPAFPQGFWTELYQRPFLEIALDLMLPFTGDSLPGPQLRAILEKTLAFDTPLAWLGGQVGVLELFHGPTLAFKDVGATFMAGCLGYFSQAAKTRTTVLVATSGDTGGAVARGFLGVPGVEVVILYPKGMVSDIQERQLTTLGENIRAFRVEGTFDDCQAMVKQAFLDPELGEALTLTSANSINVARWLPQMLYYVRAYQQAGPGTPELVYAVPSGNFGNLCAGMLACKMGMPARHFVACTNRNDTVPRYMASLRYAPIPAVATLSNAMDVADPSNFTRVLELFDNHPEALARHLSAYSFSDAQTLEGIRELHERFGYVADPHGAVGYLGLKRYLEASGEGRGVFLETAHPIKFRETVERCLHLELELPTGLMELMAREKVFTPIAGYTRLKEALLTP